MALPWVFYASDSLSGERLRKSYYATVTNGTLYRESISFVDKATGNTKVMAEAQCLAPQSFSALNWALQSSIQEGNEKLSEVYTVAVTGGRLVLNITYYFDHASVPVSALGVLSPSLGGIKAVDAVISYDVQSSAASAAAAQAAAIAASEAYTDSAIPARIFALDSDASVGSSPTEALTVTGLLTTDVILAVTQQTAGASSTALVSYDSVAALADTLNVAWTADPGAGAKVRVLVYRAP